MPSISTRHVALSSRSTATRLPAHNTFNSHSWGCVEIRYLWNFKSKSLCFIHNGIRNGVFTGRLNSCCQLDHIHSVRLHQFDSTLFTTGFPSVNVPVLSKIQVTALPASSRDAASFDKDAPQTRFTSRNHDCHWGCKTQCAHGHEMTSTVTAATMPVSVSPSNHQLTAGDCCNDKNNRDENTRNFVCKSLCNLPCLIVLL